MARSRGRKQKQKQEQGEGHQCQLAASTTYSELLATTIPANSSQNADKVAQTLGIVQNVSYPSSNPERDVTSDEADGDNEGELADKLKSTVIYHAAIKPSTSTFTTKMAAHSKEADTGNNARQKTKAGDKMDESDKKKGKNPSVATTIKASENRNCAVNIWNLPDGATESMVLEAITDHKPIGKIYACDVYVIPGPNNVPPAMAVATVRFMRYESATRLVQIGIDPSKGIYVRGKRAKVALHHRHHPSYLKEGVSRVVFFRGPPEIVNPVALRKLWGIKEQTERLIIGKVEKDLCEIEWRFCSYAYNAEPAFCVFEDIYGKRENCSVWYGVDPCA